MSIFVERVRPSRTVAAALSAMVMLVGIGVAAAPAQAATTLPVGADKPYTTVQAAVSAAAAGDTIVIDPGTYTENVVVDKALTILGANQGVAGNASRGAETVIAAAVSTSPAILASAPVTVDGVAVEQASITTSNNNSAIALTDGAESSAIRNSVLQNARMGVSLALSTSTGGTVIENNVISGWTGFGVRSITSSGLTIQNNTIAVAPTGTEIGSTGVALQSSNVNTRVLTNAINARTGISLDATGAVASTGVRLAGNTIDLREPIHGNGLGIYAAQRNISDIEITGNKIIGGSLGQSHLGMEFSSAGLAGSPWLRQVVVSGNEISEVRHGMNFRGLVTDITVNKNTITASDRALSFEGGATNSIITENTLTLALSDSRYGIIVQSAFQNSTISKNTIVGNYAFYASMNVPAGLKDVTFSENTVTSMRGVRAATPSENFSITDNVFKTSGTTISTNKLQDGLVITGNQVTGGTDALLFNTPVGQEGLKNETITGNSFTGITGNGVAGDVSKAVVKENYWSRTTSRYPLFTGVPADGALALPIDPFTGADNTPTVAPNPAGAAEASATISGDILTANLSGRYLLGVTGAANGDKYPHTVGNGEWVKAYYTKAGVWSEWLQAPADGVVKFAAPTGTVAGETVFFVNFAGDVFAQVPADKLGIAPVIQTATLPKGKINASYSQQIAVTGSAPLTLKVTAGALPAGLKMSDIGLISGKPTKTGNFKVTVTATNAVGTASREYSVSVDDTVVASTCSAPRKVAVFGDVALSQKFYKEIDWMECMKYSTGWRQPAGKPVYKPKDKLSREAMAAFIYRLEAPKGYQAPKVSPFADMKAGDPFYKEISWMYEAKLSTGYAQSSGKPEYHPKEELSREAMAAFIYRLEAPKGYTAPVVSPLVDMKPEQKFYKEISWMYDVKLTTGNRVGAVKEYWPKDKLSREAMAAFIYRLVLDYRA